MLSNKDNLKRLLTFILNSIVETSDFDRDTILFFKKLIDEYEKEIKWHILN